MKFALLATALFVCSTAYADTLTLHLNQSNESYALIGQGGSGGFGTYLAQQGNCTAGASTTACTLTGTYTGTLPGFTSGNYTLLTTYGNAEGGLAATSTSKVADDGGNLFAMNPFQPDVNMSLLLSDGVDLTSIPLVTNGVMSNVMYTIAAVNSVCAGLPGGVACTQGNVGLNLGSSISSPVTGDMSYTTPVGVSLAALTTVVTPEPGWLAFGGLIPGAYAVIRRRFRPTA